MRGRRRIYVDVEEAITLYSGGKSSRTVAALLGVSKSSIDLRLAEAGVKMRRLGRQRKPGGPLHDDGRGYLVTAGRNGEQCRIHRACWEAYHGPIPDGCVVHHENGDVADNDIENLACMDAAEHTSMHIRGQAYGLGPSWPH